MDIQKLSDDHPAKGLTKAQAEFKNLLPPFVDVRAKMPQKSVFLTDNGRRPEIPYKTTLVHRQWKGYLNYWTLDLNGERVIVKPSRGNHGISWASLVYFTWIPEMNSFEKKPVAFETLHGHYHGIRPPLEKRTQPRRESPPQASRSTASQLNSLVPVQSSIKQTQPRRESPLQASESAASQLSSILPCPVLH